MDENFNLLESKAYTAKGTEFGIYDQAVGLVNTSDDIGGGNWAFEYRRFLGNGGERIPNDETYLGRFFRVFDGANRAYDVQTSAGSTRAQSHGKALVDGRFQVVALDEFVTVFDINLGYQRQNSVVIRTYDSNGASSATVYQPAGLVRPVRIGYTYLTSTDAEGNELGRYRLPD